MIEAITTMETRIMNRNHALQQSECLEKKADEARRFNPWSGAIALAIRKEVDREL